MCVVWLCCFVVAFSILCLVDAGCWRCVCVWLCVVVWFYVFGLFSVCALLVFVVVCVMVISLCCVSSVLVSVIYEFVGFYLLVCCVLFGFAGLLLCFPFCVMMMLIFLSDIDVCVGV